MEYFLIAIVLLVAFYIWRDRRRKEHVRLVRATQLSHQLEKKAKMIESGKTLATRLNNCTQAIELLKEIAVYDPKQEVLQNRMELIEQIESIQKVLPVLESLEKADRYKFKGQNKKALDAYLDALYNCRKDNVRDRDFKLADLSGYVTLGLVSTSQIEDQARALGWEGVSA